MLRQNDEAKRDSCFYIDLSDVISAERANNGPMSVRSMRFHGIT